MVNIYEPGPLEGHHAQWPVLAVNGALEVRLAETEAEVEQAQRVRYRVFYEEMNAIPSPQMRDQGRDFDKYDDVCDHLLVIDRSVMGDDGQPTVVGTYRLTRDVDAAKVGGFYTASEYQIEKMLAAQPPGTRVMELGRSCILKDYRVKSGSVQLLWKGIMAYVARFNIDLMFGCASFSGTDVDALAPALSYLHHFHSTPKELGVRALPELYVEMNRMPKEEIDQRAALHALPALVKAYVRSNCQIGEGAVIDRQFGTTDVLIYLPLAQMDPRWVKRFGLRPQAH